MNEKRWPPDDPREWINRAHSNLAQAEGGIRLPDVYLEDLCFQAQQAAEKALKAVLIAGGVSFPRTHDIAELLTILEQSGLKLPDSLHDAAKLTVYAVSIRYPGFAEPVTEDEYEETLALAAHVVTWTKAEIARKLDAE